MSYKVVFDTNALTNRKSIEFFFGGQSTLNKFSKISEIIIPDIVVEELKNQKKQYLSKEREHFLSNPFFKLMKVDLDQVKQFDIEQHITTLQHSDPVPYLPIPLKEASALEEIKKLSLGNHPPFAETSDKGFKDAYIYYTVLEYLSNLPDNETIFFVTKDVRLKEAFENNSRVEVVSDFNEFEKRTANYFKGEYFLNRLADYLKSPKNITAECIQSTHFSSDGNWVLEMLYGGQTFFVLIDFLMKEIIEHIDLNYLQLLQELANSLDFVTTHSIIGNLRSSKKYFSQENIENAIEAFLLNSKIYTIAEDLDVEEFFTSIYDALSPTTLSAETRRDFESYFARYSKG